MEPLLSSHASRTSIYPICDKVTWDLNLDQRAAVWSPAEISDQLLDGKDRLEYQSLDPSERRGLAKGQQEIQQELFISFYGRLGFPHELVEGSAATSIGTPQPVLAKSISSRKRENRPVAFSTVSAADNEPRSTLCGDASSEESDVYDIDESSFSEDAEFVFFRELAVNGQFVLLRELAEVISEPPPPISTPQPNYCNDVATHSSTAVPTGAKRPRIFQTTGTESFLHKEETNCTKF